MALGTLLNHWRCKKGWTIGQLAIRSGVSKASLSRWEAGQVQPRVRELEAVLEALNLPEVMRVSAFTHLTASRAVTRIPFPSSRELSPDQADSLPWGELPRTGALFRAMRIRAGYTQWEVAALLGVRQSTVTRWETSTESPTDDHLAAFCAALRATTDEKEVLARGPFILPAHEGPLDRDAARQRHTALLRNAVFGTWSDADLAFFQLEADLWAAAQKDRESLDLLMEVFASHTRFLVWRQRYSEARRYLTFLRRYEEYSPSSRTGLSVPAQTGLLLEAEPIIQSVHRSLPVMLKHLVERQALITHLEHRAWLYMTAAEGYAVLGRVEEASHYCAQGIATPMGDGRNRSGDPATLLFRATMYNHIGRPESALLDVDVLSEQYLTPAQHTKTAVIQAGAYASLGNITAASNALQKGYRLIETYRTVGYKSSLDHIAERL